MGGHADEFPLLSALGLYASDIRGDGNCLFNALSDQLYGHQSQHPAVRARVIEYMKENADYYKQFLDVYPGGGTRRNPKRKTAGAYASPITLNRPTQEDVDRVFDQHIQVMAKGGTWGDNMEIQAFSSAYDVDVKIYQRDFAYMIQASSPGQPRAVAHIAYHTWEHYSSIRNLDGPHSGLPQVQVKALTPEEELLQREKLSQAVHIEPWMITNLLGSLPFISDRQTVKKILEDCRGDMNTAWSKMVDSEDNASASSTQESSSMEREADSDDEFLSKPNKRQNRRPSNKHSSHHNTVTFDRNRLVPLFTGSDNDGSQESVDSAESDVFSTTEVRSYNQQESPPTDPDTINVSDQVREIKRPGRIKINPPRPSSDSPAKKRISARDKKELKKQAQKAARKERQQLATKADLDKTTAGMALRSQGSTATPPIESGFRTLFI